MQNRNQLLIVASNSFWNILKFVGVAIFSFIFSVIITRYLGPSDYGRYSYILAIITATTLFFDFGVRQALGKYVPRYFPDENNRSLAIKLFKYLVLFQFVVSAVVMTLAFFLKDFWITRLDIHFLPLWLVVILLVYIPILVTSQTFISFIASTQNLKKIAVTNFLAYLAVTILLLASVFLKLNWFYFILIQVVLNILIGLVLYILSRPLFKKSPSPAKTINKKDVIGFTSLAYVIPITGSMVSNYSEVFFLKYFSTIEKVGFYVLALTVADMIGNTLGHAKKAVDNAQFELLEQGQEDKADTLTFLTIKYSLIVFLPLVILISLIFSNLVTLFYGHEYVLVALVFPFLAISRALKVVFKPLEAKAKNNNKLFSKVVILLILGGIVNLVADYLLISRLGLIGAGMASFIGQTFTAFIITYFILKNFKFNFNIRETYLILTINTILIGVTFVFYKLDLGIGWNLLYCLIGLIVYLKALKTFKQFKSEEYMLLRDLANVLPTYLKNSAKYTYIVYKRI